MTTNADKVDVASSDKIIDSIITDVQTSNETLVLKSLLNKRNSENSKNRKKRSSLSPKQRKKKSKDKKKKCKKSKLKKERKRPMSSSDSVEQEKRVGCSQISTFNVAYPPSMENIIEKVSEDEDDSFSVGADLRLISTTRIRKKQSARVLRYSSDEESAKEKTTQIEESFPLSKTRKKKVFGDRIGKSMHISEILTKVRAGVGEALIPRNIKLNRIDGKDDPGSGTFIPQRITKSRPDQSIIPDKGERQMGQQELSSDSEKSIDVYGPRVAASLRSLEPQPVSEDDDDEAFQQKEPHCKGDWCRRISSDSRSGLFDSVRSFASSTSKSSPPFETFRRRDSVGFRKRRRGRSSSSSSTNSCRYSCVKNDEKEKEIRTSNCKRNTRVESVSSSSDSEKEWERLEREHKTKQSMSYKPYGSFYQGSKRWLNGSDERRSFYWKRGSSSFGAFADRDHKKYAGDRHRRLIHSHHNNRNIPMECFGDNGKTEGSLVSTLRQPRRWFNYRGYKHVGLRPKNRLSHISRSRSRSETSTESNSPHNSRSGSSSNGSDHKRKHHDSSIIDDHKIDKKKLLEIARKNVAQMVQTGNMPSYTHNGKLVTKPAHIQSVDQLVDFCQKLQQSHESSCVYETEDKFPVLEDKSSAFDGDTFPLRKKRTDEEGDFIRHPYALKSSAPITINITTSLPQPAGAEVDRGMDKTENESYYPVSSGVEHRDRNNKNEDLHDVNDNMFLLPPPPKPPMLHSGQRSTSTTSACFTDLPPPPPPPVFVAQDFPTSVIGKKFMSSNDVLTSGEISDNLSPEMSSFATVNPSDFEAVGTLMKNDVQSYFENWGASGSNIGGKILRKLGWIPGEGLGKSKSGLLAPLSFHKKLDRKGLSTRNERFPAKILSASTTETQDRHPVSLLMEFCTKNKWKAPLFSCAEIGPSNQRNFMWTVIVNGVVYQPSFLSCTKKHGKAQACQFVLQLLESRFGSRLKC